MDGLMHIVFLLVIENVAVYYWNKRMPSYAVGV